MPIVGVSSERTERGEFVNAGLSDCCVWANTLLGAAESIAFQVFMLYSLSPPGMLISSCQPLTFPDPRAHLSPISSFIIPFFENHGFFIARSIPSILLLAYLSVPLPFDVSLTLPRLSATLTSSIFQRYSGTSSRSLSMPSFPFLSGCPSVSAGRPRRARIRLPFPLPPSLF